MSQEKGRLFSINLEHQNFGKNFTTSGDLWYFNSKDYVFDSQSERVSNKDNTITTINKLAKQVIYDKILKIILIYSMFLAMQIVELKYLAHL